jgi:hypothetical protein
MSAYNNSHDHVSKRTVPPPPYDSGYPDLHYYALPRRAVHSAVTRFLRTHTGSAERLQEF